MEAVRFAFDGSVGEDTGRFLEGGSAEEAFGLKRGFGNDATECFNAAEYIAIQGNLDIIVRAIIAIGRIST